MSFLIKLTVFVLVVVGLGWAAYEPATSYLRERNKPKWEFAKVIRGDATRIINSTGKIEPVLKVAIGAFVSGPIVELHVDFNDEVTEGELLAKVDPLLYQAAVDRDEASFLAREADVERVKAQLKLAENNLKRGVDLQEKDKRYLSIREMDGLRADYKVQEANLKVAEASVKQATAQLNNSKTNLNYCDIRSPVNGVILARKIDPGQTLASQFQTPELFIVAPDLRKKLHVFATVDESDIGLIRKAFEEKLPVTFTVSAYPDEVFKGVIEQVRYEATELQNVITYPVVVATENPDLKLLPSMTAQLSFEVASVKDVLRIPNAALRYYPENIDWVREEDRKLLDGSQWNRDANNEASTTVAADADETVTGEADPETGANTPKPKDSNRRHVWIIKDDRLQAIEVKIGFSDSRFTIVDSGEVTEDMELVTGVKK
ncbi:MAG: efflux RND transporter periplasmic adaptor subunit [Pirellulaceae bacterium]|nr:efflux RND transporter periplasmic adaptor subunit [Pirellulaceae bacterium]